MSVSSAVPCAFLLNSLEMGGSESKTVQLANHLHARHRPIHVLYLNPPAELQDRLDPRIPAVSLERAGKLSVRALRTLHSYVARNGIGTVVAVNLYPQVYAAAAQMLIGRRGLRSIVTVNTTDHGSSWNRIKMGLYGPLLRNADGIVFGSVSQGRKWIEDYRLPPDSCRVIYNGVDADYFAAGQVRRDVDEFRRRVGLSGLEFVFGTVGQLRPEKNHGQLISALQRLKPQFPGVKAIIVGEGRERATLEAHLASQGLQKDVILAGQMDDVRPALEAMDVFVLPSIAVETFSNSALEAMAMGKPVILSDVGGAREMIEDEKSGYICPRGDLESLTARIAQLAESKGERTQVGGNARARVVDRFSTEAMVRGFDELLYGPGTGSADFSRNP